MEHKPNLEINATGEENALELAAKMMNDFRQFAGVNHVQPGRRFSFVGSFFGRVKDNTATAAAPTPKHKPK